MRKMRKIKWIKILFVTEKRKGWSCWRREDRNFECQLMYTWLSSTINAIALFPCHVYLLMCTDNQRTQAHITSNIIGKLCPESLGFQVLTIIVRTFSGIQYYTMIYRYA